MTTIRLLDARRGLNRKCEELFGNAKIAEAIYRFLCDGIEECEDAEPQRKSGKWIDQYQDGDWHCSCCGAIVEKGEQTLHNWYFCYHCGSQNEVEK